MLPQPGMPPYPTPLLSQILPSSTRWGQMHGRPLAHKRTTAPRAQTASAAPEGKAGQREQDESRLLGSKIGAAWSNSMRRRQMRYRPVTSQSITGQQQRARGWQYCVEGRRRERDAPLSEYRP